MNFNFCPKCGKEVMFLGQSATARNVYLYRCLACLKIFENFSTSVRGPRDTIRVSLAQKIEELTLVPREIKADKKLIPAFV